MIVLTQITLVPLLVRTHARSAPPARSTHSRCSPGSARRGGLRAWWCPPAGVGSGRPPEARPLDVPRPQPAGGAFERGSAPQQALDPARHKQRLADVLLEGTTTLE